MGKEDNLLTEIHELTQTASTDNVGDLFTKAVELFNQISSESNRQIAEFHISQIRSYAREADIGWQIFSNPPEPSRKLNEDEYLQIATLVSNLTSFCYGVE